MQYEYLKNPILKVPTGLFVVLVEGILVAYKAWAVSINRNPACGGLVGFLPTCPLTGLLTGIYQQENDSCLSPFACGRGLHCNGGRCTANSLMNPGRSTSYRGLFADRDYGQPAGWCSLDTDCEGFTFFNPLTSNNQYGAICHRNRCRPIIVQYDHVVDLDDLVNPETRCTVVSCPPGACLCIGAGARPMWNQANAEGTATVWKFAGEQRGLEHSPFGLTGESVLIPTIGFNVEEPIKNPNTDKIQSRVLLLAILLAMSFLVYVTLIYSKTRGRLIFLALLLLVIQITFMIFLFSRWT